MIVALLNQKGGAGKTTLALHPAGEWARGVDANPQGSALDWSQQLAREGLGRLFGIVGLARDTLHSEAPEIARNADDVVIDGPSRVASPMPSALLAAELVLIPKTPDTRRAQRRRSRSHSAAHHRRHARPARPDQDRRIPARRDRRGHAARVDRPRVPPTDGSTP